MIQYISIINKRNGLPATTACSPVHTGQARKVRDLCAMNFSMLMECRLKWLLCLRTKTAPSHLVFWSPFPLRETIFPVVQTVPSVSLIPRSILRYFQPLPSPRYSELIPLRYSPILFCYFKWSFSRMYRLKPVHISWRCFAPPPPPPRLH